MAEKPKEELVKGKEFFYEKWAKLNTSDKRWQELTAAEKLTQIIAQLAAGLVFAYGLLALYYFFVVVGNSSVRYPLAMFLIFINVLFFN